MAVIAFTINGRKASVDVAPDTPLLWVVREHLKLTGTKYGCGTGLCGACTVHVDGRAVRSCQVTASQVAGKRVTTIEGLSPDGRPSAAARLDRRAGAAMRLLPVRPDHAGGGTAGEQQEADARADRRAHGRQSLPLRHLSAHRPRHRARRAGERDMTSKRNKSARAPQPPRDARRLGRPVLRLRARRAVAVRRERALAQAAGRLNAYVTIAKDGTITIMSPALEMGQGVNTSLPLIIAEELDADWSKVKVQQAPIDAVYNHPILQQQLVVGSLTTRGYWMPCRTAAAQARRVLLDAAAERWNVPVTELTTEPSTVVHAASKRRMSYGEIAAFAKVAGEAAGDQARPAQAGEAVPADRQGRAAHRRGRQVVGQADLRHATCRCRAWSTARWRARRCAAPARPRSTATSSRSSPASSMRSRSTTASASSATPSRRCSPRAAS